MHIKGELNDLFNKKKKKYSSNDKNIYNKILAEIM